MGVFVVFVVFCFFVVLFLVSLLLDYTDVIALSPVSEKHPTSLTSQS